MNFIRLLRRVVLLVAAVSCITPIRAIAQADLVQSGSASLWLLTGKNQSLMLSAVPDPGASTITVTFNGLPRGVTVSPATLVLQPGSTAKVVFSASPTAQGGTRTASIQAVSGSINQTISLSIALDVLPPEETADWNSPKPGLAPAADYTQLMKSAAQIYNVKSDPYDAKGNGVADDGPAINKAINDAIAAGNSANDGKLRLVYIPSGTYLLKTPVSGDNAFLAIYHADNIGLLGGPHTVLLATSPADDWIQTFAVNRLTVASLVLDSAERWFTQGVITQLNAVPNSVDIQIDPGFDDPDPSTRPDLAAVTLLRVFSDPAYKTYDQTVVPTIVSKQQLSPGLWRFILSTSPSADYLGKQAVLFPDNGRGDGLDLNVTGSVRVTDVKVYPRGGGSSLGVGNTYGSAFFGNFLQGRRPGELVGGTGGTFEQNNRGVFTFTHCDISGNDDDGFDFHTFATVVNAQVGPREIVIPETTDFYAVGDTISILDWVEDKVRSETKILGIEVEPDGRHLMLDRDVTILRAGAADPTNDPSGLLDRTWDNTVQARATLTYNRISAMRARGLLIKSSPGSIIRGNYFHDVPSTALMAAPEIYWSEGPQNVDMKILDNTFVNNSLANIWVGIVTGNSTYSSASYDNRNILIRGNTFSDWGRYPQPYVTGIYGPAVSVDNTDGVKVLDNTFGTPNSNLPAGNDPLQFGVAKNCQVAGNTGIGDDPEACTQ